MLKLTNRVALSTAIELALSAQTDFSLTVGEETLTFTPVELVEKLTAMVEQLDKKAAAPKKKSGNMFLDED